jgi:hypothetical protein
MFLPDYVEAGFDHATLNGKPLVKQKNIIYESVPESFQLSLFRPIYVFSALAVLIAVISWIDLRRKKISGWIDVVLFGITGAVGLLLFLLWVATDHKAAANNLNLIWALPTHLVAAFALRKAGKRMHLYFSGVAVLNLALLLTWAWLPQQLHVALIPLVLALLIRAVIRARLNKMGG